VVALFVGPLPLADVDEEALSVERLAAGAANRRPFLADPDDAAVPREQAILRPNRCPLLAGMLDRCEKPLAVLRMQEPRKQVRLRGPFFRRVPEHRLDLPAYEERLAAIPRRVVPRCERERAHEVEMLALDRLQRFAPPPALIEPLLLGSVQAPRHERRADPRDERDRHGDGEPQRPPGHEGQQDRHCAGKQKACNDEDPPMGPEQPHFAQGRPRSLAPR
jgi:hypothetical protein